MYDELHAYTPTPKCTRTTERNLLELQYGACALCGKAALVRLLFLGFDPGFASVWNTMKSRMPRRASHVASGTEEANMVCRQARTASAQEDSFVMPQTTIHSFSSATDTQQKLRDVCVRRLDWHSIPSQRDLRLLQLIRSKQGGRYKARDNLVQQTGSLGSANPHCLASATRAVEVSHSHMSVASSLRRDEYAIN